MILYSFEFVRFSGEHLWFKYLETGNELLDCSLDTGSTATVSHQFASWVLKRLITLDPFVKEYLYIYIWVFSRLPRFWMWEVE